MENIKDLINSKSRYEKWDRFISRNDLLQLFEENTLYDDDSNAEIGFRIANNISERPKCPCGNQVIFKQNHYQEFCSNNCQSHYNSDKRLRTYKKNSGYSHPHKNPKIRKRMKERCLENYGVEHQMKSKIYVNKVKSSKLENHGDENYNNIDKIKKTNLEKYGYTSILGDQYLKEKYMLEKFGVRNFSQTGLRRNGYKWYDYELPSGRLIQYQGYEGRYIPVLLRKYGENNVCFDKKDIPKIKYILDGIERYYFPDFYIPSENLIIEVKSSYTLNVNKEMNKAKFDAVINEGFNFKLRTYK